MPPQPMPPQPAAPVSRPYDPSPYAAPPSNNYFGLNAPPPPQPAYAYAYQAAAAPQQVQRQAHQAGQAQMVIGIVILVVGLVVTLGSGTQMIAYGAVIVGLYNLVAGAANRG